MKAKKILDLIRQTKPTSDDDINVKIAGMGADFVVYEITRRNLPASSRGVVEIHAGPKGSRSDGEPEEPVVTDGGVIGDNPVG